MALLTEKTSVAPQELKPRVPLVPEEKRLQLEAGRRVAPAATTRELTQVSVLVAARALGRDRLVSDRFSETPGEVGFLSSVAFGALDRTVFSRQGIIRCLMIESRFLEPLDTVAIAAVVRELTPVRILSMAVGAPSELDFPEASFLVALPALDLAMSAEERIPGAIVVEPARAERTRVVTALAVRAQAGTVRILMAGSTGRVCDPLPLLLRVARSAFDAPMGAGEWKIRVSMIELDRTERVLDPVAPLAVHAEPPLMHVDVAGDAALIVHQIAAGVAGGGVLRPVTLGTISDRCMAAHEGIARLLMIEAPWIPTDERKVLALVLLVAGETSVPLISMKSRSRIDSRREVTMACEAFFTFDALPSRVASGTVLEPLKTRVCLTQRTR